MSLVRRSVLVLVVGVACACGSTNDSTPRSTTTRSALVSQAQLYLGAGSALAATAPTSTTPAFADSDKLRFENENPWVDIGAWSAPAALARGALTTLGASVWLGVDKPNDGDDGTFDVRIEIGKNGVTIASAERLCVGGLSDDPALAAQIELPIPVPVTSFDGSADVLSVHVAGRIGTDGAGALCADHRRNTHALRLYYDAVDRASALTATFFTPPSGPRWVVVSCSLQATFPNALATFIDSEGNRYILPNLPLAAPPAGSMVFGTLPPPNATLSTSDLVALLAAADQLDHSTAGYTTTVGPMHHLMTRIGTLRSAGAPGPSVLVESWTDGSAFGQSTFTTSNDPAAAVLERYACFPD